jgi:hypothetical protein
MWQGLTIGLGLACALGLGLELVLAVVRWYRRRAWRRLERDDRRRRARVRARARGIDVMRGGLGRR